MTDEAGNDPPRPRRRRTPPARRRPPHRADAAPTWRRGWTTSSPTCADAPVAAEAPDAGPGTVATPAPRHPVVASLAAQRRRRAAGMLVAAAADRRGCRRGRPSTCRAPGELVELAGLRDRATDSGADLAGGPTARSPGPEADTGKVAGGRAQAPRRTRGGASGPLHQRCRGRPAAADSAARRGDAPGPPAAGPARRRPASCRRGEGTLVSATYERAPAVLVFHRPREQHAGRRPVRLRVQPTGALGHAARSLTAPRTGGCERESPSPTICSISGRGASPVARPNRRPALRSTPCRSPR